jgi:hypothetical protein
MNCIHTGDIKMAAILCALGIPRRTQDPVSCIVIGEGAGRREQWTFHFDVSDPVHQENAKSYVQAYHAAENWAKFTLDVEHPIYWMKGVLENREVYLHWMRTKVAPMKQIQSGKTTVLMGARASKRTQEIIRQHIK